MQSLGEMPFLAFVYTCKCVHRCVCVCVCVCTSVEFRMNGQCVGGGERECVCVWLYGRARFWGRVGERESVCVCVSVRESVCVSVCMCECECVCKNVCVCVCVCP